MNGTAQTLNLNNRQIGSHALEMMSRADSIIQWFLKKQTTWRNKEKRYFVRTRMVRRIRALFLLSKVLALILRGLAIRRLCPLYSGTRIHHVLRMLFMHRMHRIIVRSALRRRISLRQLDPPLGAPAAILTCAKPA